MNRPRRPAFLLGVVVRQRAPQGGGGSVLGLDERHVGLVVRGAIHHPSPRLFTESVETLFRGFCSVAVAVPLFEEGVQVGDLKESGESAHSAPAATMRNTTKVSQKKGPAPSGSPRGGEMLAIPKPTWHWHG